MRVNLLPSFFLRFFCFVVLQPNLFRQSTAAVLLKDGYNSHFLSILSQSECFKRVSVPHFLLPDYTLPGSTFQPEGECIPEEAQNEIRTTLEPENNDFRLPQHILPIHYIVKLCPEMVEPFAFSGSVILELEVKEDTHTITLNIADLKVDAVSLWLHKRISPDSEEKPNEFHRIISKPTARRQNSKFKDFSKYNRNNAKGFKVPPPIIPRVRENRFRFLNLKKEKFLTITSVNISKTLQRLIVTSRELLEKNSVYKLKISFDGFASDELIGLYKTYHFDDSSTKRYSLVTQFQVSEARKVFPCFDEPAFKSTFSIVLCRGKTLQTISNMPKIATLPRQDRPDQVWDLFKTTVPMATYLVAFAILDDFEYVNCNSNMTHFKVWAPSTQIHQSSFGCEVSPPLLSFFENYFQLPYPLPKMDLIALPHFFALGMENWGLVTFLYNRLLIDDESATSFRDRQDALETISHEMAHQWFGNLVTPYWWSDIWLNEGFATFLSLLGVDHIRPSWEKMKEYVVNVLHSVLAYDSLESSHPIVIDVKEPKDFFSIFDGISYGKGCFIVRMMMHFLTKEVFQMGLQNYLRELQFKSASQFDLWRFLTSIGHEQGSLDFNMTVDKIMSSWIMQEGYPVVSVQRINPNYLSVSQNRHYQEPDEAEAAIESALLKGSESPTWWIPLSMATKGHPDMLRETAPRFWMVNQTHDLLLDEPLPEDHWYILNVQQTGVFRVNYDVHNWELISQQLREEHTVFDDITRSQLVDDCFSLAYADKVDYRVAMRLISYMEKEDSPFVILAAIENLKPILESFSHDVLYGEFKDLIVAIMGRHYPAGGIVSRTRSVPFLRETENLLIQTLCPFYKPCIRESKQLFEEWVKSPSNESLLERKLLETVLCVVVAEGGEDEWETLWLEFSEDPSSTYAFELISALTCTRHMWLSSRLLLFLSMDRWSIVNKIFLPVALGKLAENPVSMGIAWDYLRLIWPKICETEYEKIYFEAVVSKLRTEVQLNELKDFVLKEVISRNTTMHHKYIQELIMNLNRKIDFQNRNYDEFFFWFLRRQAKPLDTLSWQNKIEL